MMSATTHAGGTLHMTIEVNQWRSIMGRFVTGVNVVTTVDKSGNPVGLTANAFSSVSLEPPLLLICADRKSETLKSLLGTKRFCVNILCEEQDLLARTFASKTADKFLDVPYRMGTFGMPILDGCIASVEVELVESYEVADHYILVGRGLMLHDDGELPTMPLAFFSGRFHKLSA